MPLIQLLLKLRGIVARSWWLSWCLYRLHRLPLVGPPDEEVWYFAYGANMNDGVFCGWRGMNPLDWRPGRVRGFRLRFNLDGRPKGKTAPANLFPDPQAEAGKSQRPLCAIPELPSPRFNLGGCWLTVVAVHDWTWLKPMPDDAWRCVVASPCRSPSEDQNQTKSQRAKRRFRQCSTRVLKPMAVS